MPRPFHNQLNNNTNHSIYQTDALTSQTQLLEDIKANTANISLNVDSLEVNTDNLETLQTATNTKLDTANNATIRDINNTGSIGDGSSNATSLILGYDRSGGKGRALKVDANGNLDVNVISMSGGGDATAANQVLHNTKLDTIAGDTTSLDGKITACNTGAVVVSSSALPSGAATSALQGAGLPASLSTGSNLKVSIEEGQITGFSTSALQTTGNNSLSSIDGKITACNTGAVVVSSSALPSGAATSALQGAGLPATLSTGSNLKVSIEEGQITGFSTSALQTTGNTSLATIAGDTTSLDGKITACNTGAVVVSSSALPSGAATSALQTTGNTSLSTIAGDTTSLDGKITACNTGAVIISSSALPSGGSTSALQTTGNNSLSSIDGKITACNTGAVVVSSSALPSGAATSALQGAGLPAALSTGSNLKVSIEEGQISGFATSALQTTGNTSLATIAGDTTSIDGKITACNTGAVVVSSSALPSGGATSALQTTGNTSLATIAGDTTSIDGKITACNTGAVVVSSSALPSGGATSALQTTGNTSLSTIAGDTTSIDGKITQGYDSQIPAGGNGLQQVLIYGRNGSGNLDCVNVDPNGHLKVISAVVENKGSEGNVLSNSSLANSTTTSSINISDFSKLIYMYEDSNTSNSNGIRIEVSEDNSRFYVHSEFYPVVYGSVRQSVANPALDMNGIKYIRFNNHNTGAANDLTNVYISVLGTPN